MSKQQRFDHTTIGEYIAKEGACLNIAISINNWCREWSRYIRGYILIIYIFLEQMGKTQHKHNNCFIGFTVGIGS